MTCFCMWPLEHSEEGHKARAHAGSPVYMGPTHAEDQKKTPAGAGGANGGQYDPRRYDDDEDIVNTFLRGVE